MTTDPNPTDAFAKELARVADLHRQLDRTAKDTEGGVYSSNFTLLDTRGVRHTYTAQEIRDWPKVKAALVARLLESQKPDDHTVMAWGSPCCTTVGSYNENSEGERNRLRGFVLYRSMLRPVATEPVKECAANDGQCGPYSAGDVVQMYDRLPELRGQGSPAPWHLQARTLVSYEGRGQWLTTYGDRPHHSNFRSAPPPAAEVGKAEPDQREEQTGLLRGVRPMHPENTKPDQPKAATVYISTPPRSGKSAFQEKLAALARARGEQVAVLRPEREYRTSVEGEWRRWDSDRYHGIPTSTLDERIVAARAELSKELAEPMSKRRARLARKYDGRPGIDLEQAWSTPGEES